jgi:hypothetical protein
MENNLKNYVDEIENEKLISKVLKLENTVKKLTSENNNLKVKVNNLENIVQKICEQLKITDNTKNDLTNIKNKQSLLTDEEIEETWLYYTKKGLTKEKIINKLNFNQEAVVTELKAENWDDEKKVLIDLLNSFPKYAEFSEDWSSMSVKQLKNYLQTILSSTLVGDFCIVLRNLPSKNQNNYDSVLSHVATLAEIMYSTWEELEVNNELMGKMALVLESDEELQILNIVKNNTRLILFVEAL